MSFQIALNFEDGVTRFIEANSQETVADAAAEEIDLKPLLSGVRTEDEGLFVLQHKYWQQTMLKAAAGEPALIPVEAVQ